MEPDRHRLSDAELMALADPDAFAILYDRHVRAVFAWARARAGDHATDLTAEVFARAWLSRRSFRDEADGSAFPWLCGIAQNVLRDSLRKRRVEERARARLGLPREIAPDAGYEAVERRLSLPESALRALEQLPDRDRRLLNLRVLEERSYADIADRLRCTPQAARLRFSRAVRRLNTAIQGDDR